MLKNTTSQGTETYRILPFEASTVLYYEYQGVMRRKVSTWRITSFHLESKWEAATNYIGK